MKTPKFLFGATFSYKILSGNFCCQKSLATCMFTGCVMQHYAFDEQRPIWNFQAILDVQVSLASARRQHLCNDTMHSNTGPNKCPLSEEPLGKPMCEQWSSFSSVQTGYSKNTLKNDNTEVTLGIARLLCLFACTSVHVCLLVACARIFPPCYNPIPASL